MLSWLHADVIARDLHALWVIRNRERTINEILAERAHPIPDGPTGDNRADLGEE